MSEFERDWNDLPIAELHQLDALCDRFEQASLTDPGTRIEPFIGDVGPHQRLLLRALVQLEVERRYTLGQPPAPDEYAERFPSGLTNYEH